MKHLLLLDAENDFEADVKRRLAESFKEDICIETAKSVSEVLKKSTFWKSTSLRPVQDNYDIFIILLKKTDSDCWNFVQYVARNKPELPVIMLSLPDSGWLTNRFISKTEKKPMRAATKQELVDNIRILLSGIDHSQ